MTNRSSTLGFMAATVAAMGSGAAAHDTWVVQYHASSGVYPESNGDGWVYDNSDPGGWFQRDVGDGELWETTMPPGALWDFLLWRNFTGPFNFQDGFVMEASVLLITETDSVPRWGGASIYSVSDAGYNMDIEIEREMVSLGSIFEYVSYPMDTTDTFHTYRAESIEDFGRLYVDGQLVLELELERGDPGGWISFGDQGWEGGNISWQHVRYGVPNACAADFNGDGQANGIDVGLFLQAYGTQDPSADMNGDGSINGIDVGLFLQAYGQGC